MIQGRFTGGRTPRSGSRRSREPSPGSSSSLLSAADDLGGLADSGHSLPLWVNLTSPTGLCALALIPALHAGWLSAIAAIADGPTPRQGHGHTAHRLADKLVLPRTMTIRLAAPFSRPGRRTTLAAIVSDLAASNAQRPLEAPGYDVIISLRQDPA